MNKKVIKNIAGAVCAGLFVYNLIPLITGSWIYMMPLPIILMFVKLVCLLILTINLFVSKNSIGKFAQLVAAAYTAIELFSLAEKSMFAFPMVGAILLVVFVTTFLMAVKTVNGKLYDTTDTTSEAAKVEMQAVKQEEIYDQQLRDGILTKEEYDMILENRKQILSGN